MRVSVRVTGDDFLSTKLKKLELAAAPRNVRLALEDAADPIIADAKGRVDSDRIREGIQVVQIYQAPDGSVVAEVGLPGGRKPWFMGLFKELGTGPRFRKDGGRTGSMPAEPFLRPAARAQRKAAIARYGARMKRFIMGAARG